jgi:hypothetical protein
VTFELQERMAEKMFGLTFELPDRPSETSARLVASTFDGPRPMNFKEFALLNIDRL